MRGVREVRDEVLARAGRYQLVRENLQVKEVQIEDRRYVVCFNPEEAAKDRADREQILATLEKKLASGGVKRLIPNRGYRRFLKIRAGQCTIDQQRVEEDARYDGKYVLRATTDLPADEVAPAYKNLLWIERLFRDLKSLLETRPIYHHWVKDNVKGHIFACFLALYLVVVLRKKIAALGRPVEWADLIRDLSQLRAIGLQLDDQHYLLRTDLRGTAHVAFQAVGLRPPPLAQVLVGPGLNHPHDLAGSYIRTGRGASRRSPRTRCRSGSKRTSQDWPLASPVILSAAAGAARCGARLAIGVPCHSSYMLRTVGPARRTFARALFLLFSAATVRSVEIVGAHLTRNPMSGILGSSRGPRSTAS
jgi:hypothetical protein